jgi:hypothetical protein
VKNRSDAGRDVGGGEEEGTYDEVDAMEDVDDDDARRVSW